MDQKPKLFTDLPSDVLIWVLSECCVLDVLSISSTCKRLQRISDEYQVWLDQARCLQIHIPPGMAPSKAELKDWVISRTRVDVCWTKSRPGDLLPHPFETNSSFVDALFIPGGEFIVLLYHDGDIGLIKIERSAVTGELEVQEVARYNETDDIILGSWSSLLTETSYGCPVLVLVDGMFLDHEVFLIDPVLQVIEKQGPCCNFDDDTVFHFLKISAIKDRMLFIYKDVDEAIRITVVEEPGPNVVEKRFYLTPPAEYDTSEVRFFVISENCFVATHRRGILLYHIPELGAADEDAKLVPVWDRLLDDASGYCGTLFETASPYPGLWLQGKQSTHTIEFDVDGSGCYPVVVNHHIAEGQPAFHVGDTLQLQGRKGMSIETGWSDEILINTGVLGKPDTRPLRVPVPGLNHGHLGQDEVKYTDFDEMTGRIMVVVGPEPGRGNSADARRLYIADIPS